MFPEKEHENIAKINDEYRALPDHEELKKFKDLSISEFWEEIGNIKNELRQIFIEKQKVFYQFHILLRQ